MSAKEDAPVLVHANIWIKAAEEDERKELEVAALPMLRSFNQTLYNHLDTLEKATLGRPMYLELEDSSTSTCVNMLLKIHTLVSQKVRDAGFEIVPNRIDYPKLSFTIYPSTKSIPVIPTTSKQELLAAMNTRFLDYAEWCRLIMLRKEDQVARQVTELIHLCNAYCAEYYKQLKHTDSEHPLIIWNLGVVYASAEAWIRFREKLEERGFRSRNEHTDELRIWVHSDYQDKTEKKFSGQVKPNVLSLLKQKTAGYSANVTRPELIEKILELGSTSTNLLTSPNAIVQFVLYYERLKTIDRETKDGQIESAQVYANVQIQELLRKLMHLDCESVLENTMFATTSNTAWKYRIEQLLKPLSQSL